MALRQEQASRQIRSVPNVIRIQLGGNDCKAYRSLILVVLRECFRNLFIINVILLPTRKEPFLIE